MAEFVPGAPITTTSPTVEVTVTPQSPLPPGQHRFQLVVVDNDGNVSDPTFAEVVIKGTDRPTAVIDAPQTVPSGKSFNLSGARSSDVAPGRIVEYRWTLMS